MHLHAIPLNINRHVKDPIVLKRDYIVWIVRNVRWPSVPFVNWIYAKHVCLVTMKMRKGNLVQCVVVPSVTYVCRDLGVVSVTIVHSTFHRTLSDDIPRSIDETTNIEPCIFSFNSQNGSFPLSRTFCLIGTSLSVFLFTNDPPQSNERTTHWWRIYIAMGLDERNKALLQRDYLLILQQVQ